MTSPSGDDVQADSPDVADIMRRAEAAVAALQERYMSVAKADLARLADGARRLAEPGQDAAAALHDIHRAAHDMKGQGATFNYPLVTTLGASLCRLVKGRTSLTDGEKQLVDAHVDALRTILEGEVAGEGDASIRATCDRLEQAVASAAAA
ncbi:MAG: Hpt domain-containing protein [Alphaproteobacteria bacterium]